jgi:hypothetical protein
MHSPLHWDERYKSFIRHAGFLPLARLVNRGLPLMDAAALTALVDQWRLETQTFHLPSGGTPSDRPLAFDPLMSQGIRRTGRRRGPRISGGSQLPSTPARRVLRMPSFRGMFGLVFHICMMSDSLVP